jgi:hypothetical protein
MVATFNAEEQWAMPPCRVFDVPRPPTIVVLRTRVLAASLDLTRSLSTDDVTRALRAALTNHASHAEPAPAEVYASLPRLLHFTCSERTMYRVLERHREVRVSDAPQPGRSCVRA